MKKPMCDNYHHVSVLPALAVIAELATSDENLTTTVPLADGVSIPSISAILPAVVGDETFTEAGALYTDA
jgi:hypothetical protein